MTKITHVIIPHTTLVACGSPSCYSNALYREQVTCKRCKKTTHYKNLKNIPRKFGKFGFKYG